MLDWPARERSRLLCRDELHELVESVDLFVDDLTVVSGCEHIEEPVAQSILAFSIPLMPNVDMVPVVSATK